ncbi:MAG: hypothetical protein U0798_07655 [Gemmataceae bacterium]
MVRSHSPRFAPRRREADGDLIEMLNDQLDEITEVNFRSRICKTAKVPLYVNPEYPGVQPLAEYHPDANWLKKNGLRRYGGECRIHQLRNFKKDLNRMPWLCFTVGPRIPRQVVPKGFANPDICGGL